jgi:Secretion system C-terminal sorting domain
MYMYYPLICGMSDGERIFVDRDTLINGITYSIFAAHPIVNVNSGPFCYPLAVNDLIKYDKVILREDTISKKVYQYNSVLNSDTLIIDFSLTIGDTIPGYSVYPSPYYLVDSIGSIQLANATFRNIYYTTAHLGQVEYIIEGIGGSRGPYHKLERAIDGENIVTCYTESGIPLWGNPAKGGSSFICLGLVGIEDINSQLIFNLYPNPATDKINVVNLSNKSGSFSLFDKMGRLVLTQNIIENNNIIDISSLVPDTYFYRIYTELINSRTGKVVIITL